MGNSILDTSTTIETLPTKQSKELQPNATLQLTKGRGYRYYNASNNQIKIWVDDRDFEAGDIVVFGVKNSRMRGGKYDYKKHGDDSIYQYNYWAMCMKQHKSNDNNKLKINQIFYDLVINLVSNIKPILIEHVHGFNDELSHIIIDYCYSTNEYWWIGCHEEQINKSKHKRMWRYHDEECGNLSYGIYSTKCKLCVSQKTLNNDIKYGCVIKLEKNTGNMSRIIDTKTVIDAANNYRNVILKTQITSETEKQQIFNLLSRNFNDSMNVLIKCCMNKQSIFRYKINDEAFVIDIGNNTYLWALYNNMNELLCALIWRKVNGTYTTRSWTSTSGTQQMTLLPHNFSMFEVLFLSTFENVRYKHYGYEMVKRIVLYARANCFDIISVAAVPGHGVGFWSKNGFVEIYDSDKCLDTKLKRDVASSQRWGLTITQQFDVWILKNMLVFQDTPLFAKYLS